MNRGLALNTFQFFLRVRGDGKENSLLNSFEFLYFDVRPLISRGLDEANLAEAQATGNAISPQIATWIAEKLNEGEL